MFADWLSDSTCSSVATRQHVEPVQVFKLESFVIHLLDWHEHITATRKKESLAKQFESNRVSSDQIKATNLASSSLAVEASKLGGHSLRR